MPSPPTHPAADHQAWLVDLDGTLYHPLPVKLAMAADLAVAGLRQARILQTFRSYHEKVRLLADESDAGRSPFRLQVELAAQELALHPDTVEALVWKWMVHRPGPWLRRFRRRALLAEIDRYHAAGGRTALVSDYPAGEKLAAMGITELFDEVVASGEPGGPLRLKPHPEGFLRAADLLSVPPAACLVIGDRDDADGEAARRAGMRFRKI
ncbi:MAG TPA: HAD family hydrolase [Planctomycetes bacterium]|nr:HAD family hydrolase [Planctomycetota bacterium]